MWDSLQQITITGGSAGALAPKIKESSSSPSHICQSSQHNKLLALWHLQAHINLPLAFALILITSASPCQYHHNLVLARFSHYANSLTVFPLTYHLSFLLSFHSSCTACRCPICVALTFSFSIRHFCMSRCESLLFVLCFCMASSFEFRLFDWADSLISTPVFFISLDLRRLCRKYSCGIWNERYWAAGKAAACWPEVMEIDCWWYLG